MDTTPPAIKNIIRDIYYYYYSGGYTTLAIHTIISLLSSYLLLFLFYFVVDCIDYAELFHISSKNITHISQIISLDDWFPTNTYLIICFAFYSLYLLVITYRAISSLFYYRNIRTIYRDKLMIRDDEIEEYSWENVVSRLQSLNPSDNQINIFNMNAVISQNENFLIAMIREGIITIPSFFNLNRILEWNLLFAVVSPLKYLKPIFSTNALNFSVYNSIYGVNTNYRTVGNSASRNPFYSSNRINGNEDENEDENEDDMEISLESPPISPATLQTPLLRGGMKTSVTPAVVFNLTPSIIDSNSVSVATHGNTVGISNSSWTEYYNRVAYRLNLMLIINICALPFAILIILVYLLLNNGARLYYKPSIIFGSTLSGYNKWRLRYYNEPLHKFDDRLNNINSLFAAYTQSFYFKRITKSVNEILIFIIGSIFIILVALSFISADFAYLVVFNDKNILWCIGILGSILVIYHSNHSNHSNTPIPTKTSSQLDESNQKTISLILLSLDEDAVLMKKNKIISRCYISNLRNMINELLTIIFMPWIIFKIRREILCKKEMSKILDYYPILGMICKYAIFSDSQFMSSDLHMLLSYYNFRICYPNFGLGIVTDWNSNNVRKISDIVGGVI